MKKNSDNTRYVLWTGGFDSTFMILKYAREEIIIQPIYVIDPGRKSIQFELKAMRTILHMLETEYAENVKAQILPLRIYEMKDIITNKSITASYEKLSKRVRLGTQYEWLARLASMYSSLDLGVERHVDGYGGCTTAIMNDGGFIIENGVGKLNTENASEDTIRLLGRFRFPIINFTGQDMLSLVQSWGWDEIIQNIWFCHNPINNSPCGMCRPCQQKMEDRMECLLPIKAQRRYKLFHETKRIFGNKTAERATRLYRYLFK